MIHSHARPAALASLLALLCSTGFAATDTDYGKLEFQTSCASCHGVSAKGDGALRAYMLKPPADLTTLAVRNNGVFPSQRVWQTIDGRTDTTIGAHGARDMPVWGNIYRSEDPQPYELHVRNRIASLLDYLSRIQQK